MLTSFEETEKHYRIHEISLNLILYEFGDREKVILREELRAYATAKTFNRYSI